MSHGLRRIYRKSSRSFRHFVFVYGLEFFPDAAEAGDRVFLFGEKQDPSEQSDAGRSGFNLGIGVKAHAKSVRHPALGEAVSVSGPERHSTEFPLQHDLHVDSHSAFTINTVNENLTTQYRISAIRHTGEKRHGSPYNAANLLKSSHQYAAKNRPLPTLSVIDGGVLSGYVPVDKNWTGFSTEEYCYAPITHKATLGRIVELLHTFHDQPQTLIMPQIAPGSFEKKLYSMYLSYLPKEKVAFDLKMNCDDRGSFTELLKTVDHGQFSVNISKPGITKGQHWHNSKWEFFIVVSGHGLIQERKIGTDEVIEFEVSGDKIQAVHMLPGYTHNIINLSETENLVTVMWANEIFDPNHPDTFGEKV